MDNEPLRQLYNRYKREIYLYLYALCRSRELAEDLTQETFLKAVLSLPDNHANGRAWLYMVARNLYWNYVKKEKKNIPMEEVEELSDDGNVSLPEQIIQNEQKQLLYQALQHLSAARREILVLQYFTGLSQKEIAVILQQTPENIRVQAYRGRKELRAYMEEHGYDIS